MKKFYVREANKAQSDDDIVVIHALTLAGAKRNATKTQVFQGALMSLEDEYGQMLAVKEGGKWSNVDRNLPEDCPIYRTVDSRGLTLCFEKAENAADATQYALQVRGLSSAYVSYPVNI